MSATVFSAGAAAPRATMRLQLHKDFDFAAAATMAPYAAKLGVSHLYLSPIMTARAGSKHGYDVVDPTAINPELGGRVGFDRLAEAARREGLGLVVDIVPNHMAVGKDDNAWWLDVLRNGRDSAYADHFDIDWRPTETRLADRLLAPFLAKPYREALESGEVKLVREDGLGWVVRHYDHAFPIRSEDARELDADTSAARACDCSTPEGVEAFHQLLERQNFRLASWATANDSINWRRFFDVTDLAALAAERPHVFEATHSVVLGLYEEGLIDGVRVDHVDGLSDPGGYCRRLRAELEARRPRRPEQAEGHAWLVVEKILAHEEALPADWKTDGTTGYDFMSQLADLQHDAGGCAVLAGHWTNQTGRPAAFNREEEAARREIVQRSFSAQLDGAVAALQKIAFAQGSGREHPTPSLRRCLIEVLAQMRAYRSYGEALGGAEANPFLRAALTAAERRCWSSDRPQLAAIGRWLAGPALDGEAGEHQAEAVRRFEQLSAPVSAKSVEDTAFYRFGPLLSRNDVGFDPAVAPGGVDRFHEANRGRAGYGRAAMLTSATHDHKRGEDIRARLAVLSEIAHDWIEESAIWREELHAWRRGLGEPRPPLSPGDELMMLQMIVGAWPAALSPDDGAELSELAERLKGWQQKALREAKLVSAWDAPDEDYENAAHADIVALLTDADLAGTRARIAAFVARIAPAAAVNGLGQMALKLSSPGVPDIYQGTEYWDHSLVDPDNRRPVDYDARTASLGRTGGDWRGGAIKQRLAAAILGFRRERPALFAEGSYEPVVVEGPGADHLVAFLRREGDGALLVVVPRLAHGLVGDDLRWKPNAFPDTTLRLPGELAQRSWRDVLGGGERKPAVDVPAAVLFGDHVVAVLTC